MRLQPGRRRVREGAQSVDAALILKLHWDVATLLAKLQHSGAVGGFTFSELRVIHALATHGPAPATALCARLCIDAGYLSRIVRRLIGCGMVRSGVAGPDADARCRPLAATSAGRRQLARYERDASRCLQGLSVSTQE